MTRLLEWRWSLLISLTGLLIWAGFLWNFTHELNQLQRFWPPFLAFLLGSGFSGSLVFAGYWFGQENWVDNSVAKRIYGWGLGGLLMVTGTATLSIVIRLAERRLFAEPQLDILLSLSGGMLGGVIAGYLYERVKTDREHARQGRNALSLLNRTLRHEFLNSLNIIQGRANLLGEELTDDELQSWAASIQTQTEDMSEVIQNVRAFGDTFTGERHLEPIDLSKILAQRVTANREIYPHVDLKATVPEGIYVEANQAIARVFENLIQNAIEHNETEDPEVTITLEADSETVTVAVADNGPGIANDVRNNLSAPDFERTHGFGLYLSEQLVTHYRGNLTIDGESRGTTVTIELPRAEPG